MDTWGPCNDRDRGWSAVPTSQGTPMVAGHRRSWDGEMGSSLCALRAHVARPHLDLGLSASGTLSSRCFNPSSWPLIVAAPRHSLTLGRRCLFPGSQRFEQT